MLCCGVVVVLLLFIYNTIMVGKWVTDAKGVKDGYSLSLFPWSTMERVIVKCLSMWMLWVVVGGCRRWFGWGSTVVRWKESELKSGWWRWKLDCAGGESKVVVRLLRVSLKESRWWKVWFSVVEWVVHRWIEGWVVEWWRD